MEWWNEAAVFCRVKEADELGNNSVVTDDSSGNNNKKLHNTNT